MRSSTRINHPENRPRADSNHEEAESIEIGYAALGLFILFGMSAAFYWHGFGPMGDADRYVSASLNWYEHGPFLGENHWALRHLFVGPMALSFAVLGPSEFAATAPNIFYAAALVAVTFFFGRRYLGVCEGLIAGGLIAISAFFVARPMEIGVYGPEIFFGSTATWLFVCAQIERRRAALLIGAGLFAGLAWTIREQTIFLIITFGLLTLGMRRQAVVSLTALAVGFGAILLAEWIAYWLAAGDPFYRYKVDLHHTSTGWATLDAARDPIVAKIFRPFKDLFTDPITTPIMVLAAIVAILLPPSIFIQPPARRIVIISFGFASIAAVIVSAYGFDLALPRYYPILPYSACLLLGVNLAAVARIRGRWPAWFLLALIVLLNAAGEDFNSYNEYNESRRLAELAWKIEEPIYTDPLTASRTRHLLRLARMPQVEIAERIKSEEVIPGEALFFKAEATKIRGEDWCVLLRDDVRPVNWTHALIRRLGVAPLMGKKVEEIVSRPQPVELVRVLPETSAAAPVASEKCL